MDATTSLLESFDQRWQSLTIANDFVFCKAMLDPDLCRDVLEAILDIPIERVEYVGRQEQLDTSPDSKSVRLDVYVRDAQGTVFDVEMQLTNTHELPQRCRYYHSAITIDQIGKGESYRRLKDAYVIFVCNFDPFDLSRRVYFFENRCRDAEFLTLGDGTKTVFLAATSPKEGTGSRLDEFLDYVATGTISGTLSSRLDAAVTGVLDNQKWRLEYMMLEVRDQLNYDRGVLYGRKEGFELGHGEGLARGLQQGHDEGLAEGLQQGREAGLAEGLQLGEERLSRLIRTLIDKGEADIVPKALADPDLLSELYRSHGIA